MKFIHCADIHLGSKMEAKLPKSKADERKAEVRATFGRMVAYAKKEGVKAILLSGDVFDSDSPFKTDKAFFYAAVEGSPEIDFLYLRGNHDGSESYTKEPSNLKLFSEEWTEYAYENVRISGIELSPSNATSLYSTLRLEKDKINIVMLHGQESSSVGADNICIHKLTNKNIDYLALGHIHSHSEKRLDDRGRYAYSGCLEGRGFDETGEKGFVVLDVEDGVKSTFVPFASRTIHQQKVDLSNAQNEFDAVEEVKKQINFCSEDLYRIELVGELAFDNGGLAETIQKTFEGSCYFVHVKDKTLKKINLADYEGDTSLKGEFIRTVMADSTYTEEEKLQVIDVGLKAISGREVE